VVTNLAAYLATDKVAFNPGDDHMDVLKSKYPDGKFTISINGRLLDIRFR
jgi:hypothetical protein